MAYSTQSVVSDGTLVLLNVSIDYLEQSEIQVLFNGGVDVYPWEWVDPESKQIAFSPAVPNGVTVLVKRSTDISAPRHEFSKGAAFLAETLDEDIRQVLHIAQEATEGALGADFFQDLDMHGYKIRNLAPAVAATDALQKQQADFMVVESQASAASASVSATSAAASATSAAASATSAAASAAASAASITVPVGRSVVLKDSDTGAAFIPSGSTVQRPTPEVGTLRFNTDLRRLETGGGDTWVGTGGATGGGNDDVFYENAQLVTTDYSITAGKNAMSAGPITIDAGVTVTVPAGSTWSIV